MIANSNSNVVRRQIKYLRKQYQHQQEDACYLPMFFAELLAGNVSSSSSSALKKSMIFTLMLSGMAAAEALSLNTSLTKNRTTLVGSPKVNSSNSSNRNATLPFAADNVTLQGYNGSSNSANTLPFDASAIPAFTNNATAAAKNKATTSNQQKTKNYRHKRKQRVKEKQQQEAQKTSQQLGEEQAFNAPSAAITSTVPRITQQLLAPSDQTISQNQLTKAKAASSDQLKRAAEIFSRPVADSRPFTVVFYDKLFTTLMHRMYSRVDAPDFLHTFHSEIDRLEAELLQDYKNTKLAAGHSKEKFLWIFETFLNTSIFYELSSNVSGPATTQRLFKFIDNIINAYFIEPITSPQKFAEFKHLLNEERCILLHTHLCYSLPRSFSFPERILMPDLAIPRLHSAHVIDRLDDNKGFFKIFPAVTWIAQGRPEELRIAFDQSSQDAVYGDYELKKFLPDLSILSAATATEVITGDISAYYFKDLSRAEVKNLYEILCQYNRINFFRYLIHNQHSINIHTLKYAFSFIPVFLEYPFISPKYMDALEATCWFIKNNIEAIKALFIGLGIIDMSDLDEFLALVTDLRLTNTIAAFTTARNYGKTLFLDAAVKAPALSEGNFKWSNYLTSGKILAAVLVIDGAALVGWLCYLRCRKPKPPPYIYTGQRAVNKIRKRSIAPRSASLPLYQNSIITSGTSSDNIGASETISNDPPIADLRKLYKRLLDLGAATIQVQYGQRNKGNLTIGLAANPSESAKARFKKLIEDRLQPCFGKGITDYDERKGVFSIKDPAILNMPKQDYEARLEDFINAMKRFASEKAAAKLISDEKAKKDGQDSKSLSSIPASTSRLAMIPIRIMASSSMQDSASCVSVIENSFMFTTRNVARDNRTQFSEARGSTSVSSSILASSANKNAASGRRRASNSEVVKDRPVKLEFYPNRPPPVSAPSSPKTKPASPTSHSAPCIPRPISPIKHISQSLLNIQALRRPVAVKKSSAKGAENTLKGIAIIIEEIVNVYACLSERKIDNYNQLGSEERLSTMEKKDHVDKEENLLAPEIEFFALQFLIGRLIVLIKNLDVDYNDMVALRTMWWHRFSNLEQTKVIRFLDDLTNKVIPKEAKSSREQNLAQLIADAELNKFLNKNDVIRRLSTSFLFANNFDIWNLHEGKELLRSSEMTQSLVATFATMETATAGLEEIHKKFLTSWLKLIKAIASDILKPLSADGGTLQFSDIEREKARYNGRPGDFLNKYYYPSILNFYAIFALLAALAELRYDSINDTLSIAAKLGKIRNGFAHGDVPRPAELVEIVVDTVEILIAINTNHLSLKPLEPSWSSVSSNRLGFFAASGQASSSSVLGTSAAISTTISLAQFMTHARHSL